MSRLLTRSASVAAVALLLGASVVAQGGGGGALKAGEKAPEATFSGVTLNGDGRTELKEFIGNVIVVDFWGYH
jgi:hypothetical protein